MAFQQIYTNTLTTKPLDLGSFAGASNFLEVPFSIFKEYGSSISSIALTIEYSIYFDFVGWTQGAFKYDQSIFTQFFLPSADTGISTVQLDGSNSKVSTFNTEKDATLVFNPSFGGSSPVESDTVNYPVLQATHQASIVLKSDDGNDVNYINGANGSTLSFFDLVENNAIFTLGGGATNFQKKNVANPSFDFNSFNVVYSAKLAIQAESPGLA